jgi:hypothetical protein
MTMLDEYFITQTFAWEEVRVERPLTRTAQQEEGSIRFVAPNARDVTVVAGGRCDRLVAA